MKAISKLTEYARANVRSMNNVELSFLKRLCNDGRVPFDFQTIVGFYIVDFIFPTKLTILEIDGKYHNRQMEYDERRERFLKEVGFEVMRLSNKDSAKFELHTIYSLPDRIGFQDAMKLARELYDRANGKAPGRDKRRRLKGIHRPRSYQEVNDNLPAIDDSSLFAKVKHLEINYDRLEAITDEKAKEEKNRLKQFSGRRVKVIKRQQNLVSI